MKKNGKHTDPSHISSDSRTGGDSHFALNRECFMGLYDTMNEGLAYTDTMGVIIHANPAFCALLDYSEAQLIGRTMLSLTPEEERENEKRAMMGLMDGTDLTSELEKSYIHNNGHTVPVRVRFWVNRDETGKPLGIWGVVNDLTGQREIERQVSMAMEQNRFLANNSEEVIWAVNDRMEYIYASPAVKRIRGFSPDELVGTSLEDAMIPESYALMLDALDRAKATSKGKDDFADQLVLELRCKDGSTIWVEIMFKGMWDVSGNWLGLVGSSRDITDRREVEERLKANESYLKALVSATNDFVGLFTPDGTILTVNQQLARAMGASEDDLSGQSVFDYVPAEHLAAARTLFREAVNARVPASKEVIWAGRMFTVSNYPLVDEDGSLSALASYVRDVTESRMAEKEQRKAQEQFRLMVETANEGILGLDADQRITYANDIIADLFGYGMDEIIGHPITDFIEPSELEENAKRLSRCAQGDKVRYERRFVRKDGSRVWTLISASPLVADEGGFLGVFAMIADITEVRQAHERLLNILNAMDADIYVSDLETHEILFMNDHMRAKYGTFIPGTKCHEHLHYNDKKCPSCRKSELLDADGQPIGTLVRERYHEGVKRWHLTHDRAIEWLEGKIVHMYLAADITELKKMEGELKKAIVDSKAANLAKNEFLANMSHEIRTPLNGLLGMLQLIELTKLDPLQREYLATAHESGRSLLQILNDILDISKVESGKLELEDSGFELGGVLDSVVSVFRLQAEERGIKMSWAINESLQRHFLADKGRLRQILFNLVGNAAKFTVSGSIEVEAYPLPVFRKNGTSLLFFQVADTGIGIPDSKLGTVFDPFTQVDGSLTRKYQGTGLGLGIVSRLVHLMNGTITIISEEGAGTTIAFTVEATPNPAHKPEAARLTQETTHRKLSILVAEDEQVNRVVVDRILAKMGHKPTCVESGEEALNILREQPFDLILTDIQMPGMDGMDTTRAIRNELGIRTPVIALTAHTMKGDRERFVESGMNGYIAKPFELNELRSEIDRVMADAPKKTD